MLESSSSRNFDCDSFRHCKALGFFRNYPMIGKWKKRRLVSKTSNVIVSKCLPTVHLILDLFDHADNGFQGVWVKGLTILCHDLPSLPTNKSSNHEISSEYLALLYFSKESSATWRPRLSWCWTRARWHAGADCSPLELVQGCLA